MKCVPLSTDSPTIFIQENKKDLQKALDHPKGSSRSGQLYKKKASLPHSGFHTHSHFIFSPIRSNLGIKGPNKKTNSTYSKVLWVYQARQGARELKHKPPAPVGAYSMTTNFTHWICPCVQSDAFHLLLLSILKTELSFIYLSINPYIFIVDIYFYKYILNDINNKGTKFQVV